jgi:hypothetical protein
MRGRPTLYRPENAELARKFCMLGFTNETLAGFFGVARRTVDNWIATHPDFTDAVKRGRAAADAHPAGNRGKKGRKARNVPFRPAGIVCRDHLLLRFEKALLPVAVISEPGYGTQKFVLLRVEPAGRQRRAESLRHAGD